MSDISSFPLTSDPYSITPGQTIKCEYSATAGSTGTFSNLGSATKPLIQDPSIPDGSFYFICVGYTNKGYPLLISDRIVQTNISYDTLYEYGNSLGKEITINGISVCLKLITSDLYDKTIAAGISGLSAGDSAWNTNIASWTSSTPNVADTAGTAAASNQMIAKGGSAPNYVTNAVSTLSSPTVGFRPILVIKPKRYSRGKIGTSLPLVQDIYSLSKGKAISCEYTVTTAGTVGVFNNLGKATKENLPDIPTSTPDGTFYLICVGFTPSGFPKLVADRNIQSGISWDVLSTAGVATNFGLATTLDSVEASIRLPRTVQDRHPSLSNYGEWDAIISLMNANGITPSNDIWNCKETLSWTSASLDYVDDIKTLAPSTARIARGLQDTGTTIETQSKFDSNQVLDYVGFRPVVTLTGVAANSRGRIGTTLSLFNGLTNIQPGKAISCEYSASAGSFGIFKNLGCAIKPNLLDSGETAPDGTFYFICVGYTKEGYPKLLADRNIQIDISWETLNSNGLCITNGTDISIDGHFVKMRLPSTLSTRTLDDTQYGEWDYLITKYKNSSITVAGDPNIWNHSQNYSWTLNNISTMDDAGTVAPYQYKIARGMQNAGDAPGKQPMMLETYASKSVGFRPLIYYVSPSYNKDTNPYRLYVQQTTKRAYSPPVF